MRWIGASVVLISVVGLAALAEAKTVPVRPRTNRNGTYVAPHVRTSPNGSRIDNWSTKGNSNPYTGKPGTKDPWKR